MAHASPRFVPGPGDERAGRTLPVFFGVLDAAAQLRRHREFDRVSVDAPWIEVDTTDGYRPGLDELAAFVSARP